jgi:hypothetical protein
MLGYFVLNAVLGIALVELVLRKIKRIKAVEEGRDSLFPAWRRLDVAIMNRMALYPGAVFLLVPKIVLLVASLLIFWVFARLLYICKPAHVQKSPRRRRWFNWVFARVN